MKSIIWSHKHGVFQMDLDAHHKIIYEYIETLEEPQRDHSPSINTVREMFRELYKYTRYHFAFEEELMQKHAYPLYLPHRNEHKDFAENIHTLRGEYLKKGTLVCSHFTQFVKSWFVDHIASSDKKFADYCSGRGINIVGPFTDYSVHHHSRLS